MELLDRIRFYRLKFNIFVRSWRDERAGRQWNVALEMTIRCGDTDHVSSHGITPLKWMRRDTTGNWNSTRKQGKSAEIYRWLVGHGRKERSLSQLNPSKLRCIAFIINETDFRDEWSDKNVECNT